MAERRYTEFVEEVCRFADTQQQASKVEIQSAIDRRDLPITFFFDSADVPVCIERTGGHSNIKKALRREEQEETVCFYAEQSVGDTVYIGGDAIDFLEGMRLLPATAKADKAIEKWSQD